jgi:hypothetical protein
MWASSMVAWFSQRFPGNDFRNRFEREKLDGR